MRAIYELDSGFRDRFDMRRDEAHLPLEVNNQTTA